MSLYLTAGEAGKYSFGSSNTGLKFKSFVDKRKVVISSIFYSGILCPPPPCIYRMNFYLKQFIISDFVYVCVCVCTHIHTAVHFSLIYRQFSLWLVGTIKMYQLKSWKAINQWDKLELFHTFGYCCQNMKALLTCMNVYRNEKNGKGIVRKYEFYFFVKEKIKSNLNGACLVIELRI